ncbi:hypothetical protein RIF29_21310 [Crotalaria pallida]|uniref:C2 domain-containing protein n=1 Tax=Crotalaria pallida TaxID=3830 RepID=A0AAN9FBB4_CROPI
MSSSSFSSSSSTTSERNNNNNNNYDVFISFRGPDTRAALKEASKISGWHIPYGTVEITVVNDIVQSVSTKLSKLCEDDSISNIRSNIREAMKMPVGILYVKVLRATRLKKKDLMGAPDPYVILKLTDDECHAIKTAVKYKNLNPEWNEQFSLAIKDPKSQALELSIYDWKQISKHDKMGMNVIPLKDITPDELKELTLNLLKTMDPDDPENEKYRGDLTVEVLYKPEDSSAIEKAPEGTPGSGGVLEVTIHEAEYVEGKHHTNPYARLIFKGLEGRTKQVMKNRCPRWEQSFQFVLDEPPTNERLLIEVESASSKMGLLHPKENLGYVLINLADVVSNKRINEKYNLIDSRRGRIQVELLWITPY